ncbi:MAG: DUF3638 domain-containing protein, partial [Chlamydiia bacterium]|nr:DUF3638 domain-containing protein [Chlamydiia bacterium]
MAIQLLPDGSLKPDSREGELFAAYLALGQKNHAKAVEWINRPIFLGGLSEVSIMLLRLIEKHPLSSDHPDGCAVKLHALLQRARDLKEKSQPLDLEVEKLFINYKRFLQRSQNLAAGCHLTPTEEGELLEILEKEIAKHKLEVDKRWMQAQKERLVNGGVPSFTLLEQCSRSDEKLPSEWRCISDEHHNADWMDHSRMTVEEAQRTLDSTFFVTAPKDLSLENHAPLFCAIYLLAKEGSSDVKASLKARTRLWHLHSGANYWGSVFTDLASHIAAYPDLHPDFPREAYHWYRRERTEFLEKLETAHNRIARPGLYGNKPSKLTPESQPSKSPPDEPLPPDNAAYPLPKGWVPKTILGINPTGSSVSLNPQFTQQDARWNTLSAWSQKIVTEKQHAFDGDIKALFAYKEGMLTPDEQHLIEPLCRELEEVQKEIEAGKGQLPTPCSLPRSAIGAMKSDAEGALAEVEKTLGYKVIAAIQLFNSQKLSPHEREALLARIGSGEVAPMELEEALDCLQALDRARFRRHNPQLTDAAIDQLTTQLLEICDLLSYRAQLKRVCTSLDKLAKCPEQQEPLYRALSYELRQELDAKYPFEGFDPEEQLLIRLFCARTGIIPRQKQMKLLRRILTEHPDDPQKIKDFVFQLIMGGGKSSVIAVLALYLLGRRRGRKALFLMPPSLIATASKNIEEGYHKAFKELVDLIQLSREEFTLDNLKKLIHTLEPTPTANRPAILSATTLQGLILELLSLSLKIAEHIDANKEPEKVWVERIELIDRALELFSTRCDAIYDEFDLIFAWEQEVVFVDGERVAIDPERNRLLKLLYSALSSTVLKVPVEGNPSLRDFVKIHRNEQAGLSRAAYDGLIRPLLAKQLVVSFSPINSHLGDYVDSFLRYLCDEIPEELEDWRREKRALTERDVETHFKGVSFDQLQKDLSFLHHLEALYTSAETTHAADLMAQAKHYLQELLPNCLSKSYKRHYGPSFRKGEEGKVIPYTANDSPSPLEFGYHWKEAALRYQSVLFRSIEPELLKSTAKCWLKRANEDIENFGKKLPTLPEFQEFSELFNARIDRIQDPQELEKAIQHIANNPNLLLDFEEALVQFQVKQTPSKLVAKGLLLYFFTASHILMSGTPWIIDGCEESLFKNYLPDLGTYGQILLTLCKKVTPEKILPVDLIGESGEALSIKQLFEC